MKCKTCGKDHPAMLKCPDLSGFPYILNPLPLTWDDDATIEIGKVFTTPKGFIAIGLTLMPESAHAIKMDVAWAPSWPKDADTREEWPGAAAAVIDSGRRFLDSMRAETAN